MSCQVIKSDVVIHQSEDLTTQLRDDLGTQIDDPLFILKTRRSFDYRNDDWVIGA